MFNDFYTAYHWLDEHPIFKDPEFRISHFEEGLCIMVVKVNPATETIEDDESLNTATRVWLEHGEYTVVEEEHVKWKGCCHNIELDVGGVTFEDAIIKLANRTLEVFGNYDAEEENAKDWEQFCTRHSLDLNASPEDVFGSLFKTPSEE